MKRLLLLAVAVMIPALTPAADAPVSPNGIALYQDYLSWKVIAPSYREDKDHIRVILGNDTAVTALRANRKPLPDGSVLAKVAWKAENLTSFRAATVPGTFAQVEFMVKDAARYRDTGGWGFARFVGKELKPYGKDAGFVKECFGCHQPVADNDYLFTRLAITPEHTK